MAKYDMSREEGEFLSLCYPRDTDSPEGYALAGGRVRETILFNQPIIVEVGFPIYTQEVIIPQ